MRIAIYPGSFDPITLGHIDIIKRTSLLFDKVLVTVLDNVRKKTSFSINDRLEMIRLTTKEIPNIEVTSYSGLLVDYASKVNATAIVRGLRAVTDFEYELQMAQTNSKLSPNIETVFLTSRLEYAYLSSSLVREVSFFGGDISKFVPLEIIEIVKTKLKGSLHNE